MLKQLKYYVLFLLGILFISPTIQNAHATAISQVNASANWSSFTLTIEGITTPDFSYGQSSKSSAQSEYIDNTGTPVEDTQSGWGDTDALSSIINASGHGYTSATSMNSDGIGIADGINNTYGRGTTYTYRIGYFSDLVNSSESNTYLLEASLEFSISHFFSYDVLTDSIGAYNQCAIGLYYIAPGGITTPIEGAGDSVIFLHYSGTTDWNGTWTLEDTLNISEYITGGKIYAIDAFLYTDANAGTVAQIPEPAIILLLGSGLVGLAGFRRRFCLTL